MDGIKPFNYRPLTPGLLGQPDESSVQPLNANHISHTNFLYPEQSSFFDTHTEISAQPNINNSLGALNTIKKGSIQDLVLSTTQKNSPEQVVENKPGYFQQQLAPLSQQISEQKKDKGNARHKNQESMTLISWLEQTQNHFPEEMPEKDDYVINSITDSAVQQSTQKHNSLQIDESQKIGSNQSEHRQDKNNNAVLPMANIQHGLHKTINAKDDKTNNPKNKIATTLLPVNIELPHNVQDQVRNPLKSNDATKVTKQVNTSRNAEVLLVSTKQANNVVLTKFEKTKPISNKKSINKNKSNTTKQENINNIFNGKHKHKLESKPVFKQTYQSQMAKVNKLQQALQVQRLNTIQPPQSEQRTERTEEQKIPNKNTPQVQQVVVINPPVVGYSGQDAFLERSYFGRLGPRSYK